MYPGGFANEEMQVLAKKHKIEFLKMKEIVEPCVAPENGAFSGFLMMMADTAK